MRTALGWAIIVGISCHLLGLGSLFAQLIANVLTIALLAAGLRMILSPKKDAGGVLGPVARAAFILGFLPAFIAGGLQQLVRSSPGTAAMFLVGGTLAAIVLIARRRRG